MEDGGETLIATVMGAIRQRIGARSLTPGAKLPSIRALATAMRVSKSTVVEAYEPLQRRTIGGSADLHDTSGSDEGR